MNGSPNVPDQKVSLGCGTLILIALIVLIFAGRPDLGPLKKELKDLQADVQRVEKKLDDIGKKLDQNRREASGGGYPRRFLTRD